MGFFISFKSFKKSQTAIEYVILLAVVIILALIVIAILGGIPTIGGATRSRASSAYWQSSAIAITSHSMKTSLSGGEHSLRLRNNFPHNIRIYNINASYSLDNFVSFNSDSMILRGGQSVNIFNQSLFDFCINAGDPFSIQLRIEYMDEETGASYLFDGAGNKLEGECSE
jgi:uncharacterized protein (UPF0333 family)